jgi:hypothetical protein
MDIDIVVFDELIIKEGISIPTYPTNDADHIKATTVRGSAYQPYFPTDPLLSVVGDSDYNSWFATDGFGENQRFHIDLGEAKVVERIYYENFQDYRNPSFYQTYGVKDFTLWGSNDPDAFTDLVWGNDDGWTQLETDVSQWAQHCEGDVPDPQYISVKNSTAYQYYALKFANTWGGGGYWMAIRRVVLYGDIVTRLDVYEPLDIPDILFDEIAVSDFVNIRVFIPHIVGQPVYVDYENGSDDGGDGALLNPFKTLNRASEVVTGGDEVRCAKSPDNIVLTGTIEFQKDNGQIYGTDTLFTTELAVEDYILAPDGRYYRITTIYDDVTVDISQSYKGESISGQTIEKVGVIKLLTGFLINGAGGINNQSRVKFSGGWDLSTETRVGVTNCFDLTFGAYAGIDVGGANYCEFEYFNLFRFSTGFSLNSRNGIAVKNCVCSDVSVGVYNSFCENVFIKNVKAYFCGQGMYVNEGVTLTIENVDLDYNSSQGLYLYGAFQTNIDKLQCNYNGSDGIYMEEGRDELTFGEVESNFNNGNGFYLIGMSSLTAGKLVANNNTNSGFSFTVGYGWQCVFNLGEVIFKDNANYGFEFYTDFLFTSTIHFESYKADGNGSGDEIDWWNGGLMTNWERLDVPMVSYSRYRDTGLARNDFYNSYWCANDCGHTYGDIANSRSGVGKCLKYEPLYGNVFLTHSFKFKAEFNKEKTVKFWLKKTLEFNGEVQGALFFNMKQVTDWTSVIPEEAGKYEQKTLSVGGSQINLNGQLALKVRVNGNQGYVYLDDITVDSEPEPTPAIDELLIAYEGWQVDYNDYVYSEGTYHTYQTFFTPIPMALTRIALLLSDENGTATEDITFEIRETDFNPVWGDFGGYEPNDTILATGVMPVDKIPDGSFAWCDLVFDTPILLDGSKTYAIVFYTATEDEQITFRAMQNDMTSPFGQYIGGEEGTIENGPNNNDNGTDLCFRIYGNQI